MGIPRLLLLLAAVWLALRFARQFRIQLVRREPPRREEPYALLRACSTCGVLTPAAALDSDQRCGRCCAKHSSNGQNG